MFPGVVLVPIESGVSRSSRTLGAGCGGRADVAAWSMIRNRETVGAQCATAFRQDHAHKKDTQTNNAARTAKSCGPGIPMLMPCQMHVRILAQNGGKTASPRGARISRKPWCREDRDVPAKPVVPAPCTVYARGPWGRRAPGLPCALLWRDMDESKPRAQPRRETRTDVSFTTFGCLTRVRNFAALFELPRAQIERTLTIVTAFTAVCAARARTENSKSRGAPA